MTKPRYKVGQEVWFSHNGEILSGKFAGKSDFIKGNIYLRDTGKSEVYPIKETEIYPTKQEAEEALCKEK